MLSTVAEPEGWHWIPLTKNMLLFHFLGLIALKEEFILAADSRMRVMRRVWCSASRVIASISRLSRARAPHVQWADGHDRAGNKVPAFKFSVLWRISNNKYNFGALQWRDGSCALSLCLSSSEAGVHSSDPCWMIHYILNVQCVI